MSSYLQSNQPYQRVVNHDGLLNGAILGGMAGAAAGIGASTYAVGVGGPKNHGSAEAYQKNMDSITKNTDSTYKEKLKAFNADANAGIAALDDKGMGKFAKTTMGTGKRRAAVAGVSMLAGAALGAGADSLFY